MYGMFPKFEIIWQEGKIYSHSVHVTVILLNAGKDVLDAFENGFFTGFCEMLFVS